MGYFLLALLILWLHHRANLRYQHILHLTHFLNKMAVGLEMRIEKLEEAETPLPAPQVEFYIVQDGQKKRIFNMIMKVSQRLPVSVEFKDKFGNAAKVDGKPAWALTDASFGTVEAADDGLSAVFTPAGKAGEALLQVNADADLGEGVKAILGELAVTLLPGDAETVSITAGEAQDI